MDKFVFHESIFGDNRFYGTPYYNWLCGDFIDGHREFLGLHDRSKLDSSNCEPLGATLDELFRDSYQDYAPKHEEKMFSMLAEVRHAFQSENLASLFVGSEDDRISFESYVKDLTRRIRRDSEKANWLSNRVQHHFEAFAVRPFVQAGRVLMDSEPEISDFPQPSTFYTLAELRDRAFRNPSKERVERYLRKVELLRKTKPYKRISYLSNQLEAEGDASEVQEIEDDLTVNLLWNELAVQH